jgi:competence protein ComEC
MVAFLISTAFRIQGMFTFIFRRPFIAVFLLYVLFLITAHYRGWNIPGNDPVSSFIHDHTTIIDGSIARLSDSSDENHTFVLVTESINQKKVTVHLLVKSRAYLPGIELGDVVRISGKIFPPSRAKNPGSFDYAAYLERQKIHYIVHAVSVRVLARKTPPFYILLAQHLKESIISIIHTYLPSKEAGILIPMLIGEKSGLDTETKQEFNDAGVTHVLVVSGFNVAYVTTIFLFLFRLTGFSRRKAAPLTIPFILLYVILTGANPPVVRAGVMALFVIISLSLAREPLIYQSLAMAAMVILLFDPSALFSASFQLSFAATIGIIYLNPYLMVPFKKMPRWIQSTAGNLFSVSLAAQLAVLPLIAYYFNKISVAGLLSNLFIVPLTGCITIAGLFLYFLHYISPLLASLAGTVNYYLLNLLLVIVHFFSKMPHATLPVATPSMIAIVLYYVVLIGIFTVRKSVGMRYVMGIVMLLGIGYYGYSRHTVKQRLSITFLSVGNGDAIHIRFPNGEDWMVDAGGQLGNYDIGKKALLPYFQSKGIRKIEKLIITHPHYSHYTGVGAIIDAIPVKSVLVSPGNSSEEEFEELMGRIKAKNIPCQTTWAGDVFAVAQATVTVVSPDRVYSDLDSTAIVMTVGYKGHSVLLTSDMGSDAEATLLARKAPGKVDVMQLPFHGNRVVSEGFMKVVNPQYCVVSTVKKRLQQILHTKCYSTKESGAIEVVLIEKAIDIE